MSKAVQKIETKEQTPAVAEANALISMIERAARDPAVDIAKMERLFEMSERVRAREAESAFNASMSAAQAALLPVVKNRKNDQTRSQYADMTALAEQALPTIHQHGFGVICSEFKSDRADHLGVACKVTHSAGHSERHEFHIPMDGKGLKGNANKTDTHAYGSSFSYGRRYAICGVFNIATKDNDGNSGPAATMREPITEAEVVALRALMKKAEVEEQILLDRFKVEDLADLTPAELKTAASKLNKKLELM